MFFLSANVVWVKPPAFYSLNPAWTQRKPVMTTELRNLRAGSGLRYSRFLSEITRKMVTETHLV